MKAWPLLATALTLTLGVAACSQNTNLAASSGTPASAPPPRLTAETFAAVRAHAAPRAEDLAFQSIPFHENLVDGALAAQKQDKPLVLWLYFGDPRGNC